MSSWYEDDAFWETWAPYLFSSERLRDAHGEVDCVFELLDLAPNEHVLDVCCGIGRHAIELLRRGCRVTGIDRMRIYLERARQNAHFENLSLNLIHSDVRSFEMHEAFDGAINMFTSFGYFETDNDDLRAAANVCRALRIGRKFVIDTEGRELLARDFRKREWFRHEDGTIGLQERNIRDGWERMDTRWILVRDGKVVWESVVSSRIYSGAELRDLLMRAGFSAVKLYGNLHRAPYDENATRLIVVASK